jgi:hypothetical protein
MKFSDGTGNPANSCGIFQHQMKPADLIGEIIQPIGLTDPGMEEGAGITDHASYMPDQVVRCPRFVTAPHGRGSEKK